MISAEQVALFARYNGDSDGFARMSTPEDRRLMSGGVWSRLDGLLVQLTQVQRELVSADYATRIGETFADEVPDATARATLYRLAGAGAIPHSSCESPV